MAQRNTGRLSGPGTGQSNWEGLGPVIVVLVAGHLAALAFWIVRLIRGGLANRARKAGLKQH